MFLHHGPAVSETSRGGGELAVCSCVPYELRVQVLLKVTPSLCDLVCQCPVEREE